MQSLFVLCQVSIVLYLKPQAFSTSNASGSIGVVAHMKQTESFAETA